MTVFSDIHIIEYVLILLAVVFMTVAIVLLTYHVVLLYIYAIAIQVFIFQKIKYHDHDIVRYRRVQSDNGWDLHFGYYRIRISGIFMDWCGSCRAGQ